MRLLVSLWLVFLLFPVAAREQESQQPSESEQQPTPEVEPAPRVVGQAQTPEEAAAWNAIGEAATPDERIRLTEQFLTEYPQSGLTPYAHYNLAAIYRQTDDVDNFILHGEKALEELPELPDVLAYLSFFYSEQGNTERATHCAEQAIQLTNSVDKPLQMSDSEWEVRKAELLGESHYALGRVALSRAAGDEEQPGGAHLTQAISHFEQALDQTPEHPYAAFRLAEALTRAQELDRAIQAYGLAAAMGGVIGDFAMSKLRTVYEYVHGNTDGIDAVVSQQRELLQQKIEEKRKFLDSLNQQNVTPDSDTSTGTPEGGESKPPSQGARLK